MKPFLIFLFILVGIGVLPAQRYYKESAFLLGVNAEYKYPLGDFGDLNKYSLGVNLSGKYLINRAIGLGFEVGYHPFKTDVGNSSSVRQDFKTTLIPALLQTTFYIPTWDRTLLPYLGLQFGAYYADMRVAQTSSLLDDAPVSKKINRFAVGIGPHAGVLIELSEFIKLDLNLKGEYVPKIKKEYSLNEYEKGLLPFDKIINISASVGLLYTF